MKKKLTPILIAILLIASTVYAVQVASKYSATLTASANVTAKPGLLDSIIMVSDGASTCTWNIYDSAGTGATTELLPTLIITTAEKPDYVRIPFDPPLEYHKGIYVDISSTGECKVYFREG